MEEIIIDAKGLILGRYATIAAKQALLGNKVLVVNASQSVISGKKRVVYDRLKEKRAMGSNIRQGPFIPTRSDAYVKRAIRGMIPYKTSKGRDALSRIRVFSGNPGDLKATITIENAKVEKLPSSQFVLLETLLKSAGGKS
jgi:large subunit ribosomal protein L13